mgnify:CR=1 FL=1
MKKKLTRSLTQRKLAGVCGGLGEYLGITPTIFRFIFLLLCLPGGVPGPILYILCWIFMPAPQIPVHTFYGFGSNQTRQGGSNLGDDYTETIDV